MTTILTATGKGAALSVAEMDANLNELARRTNSGWKDLVSPLTNNGVPTEYMPQFLPFGPSGLRREMAFEIGDYAFSRAFHVNHDLKVGGKAYCHIHWTTDGTDTSPVKWEFQISRALGHQQAYFTAETSFFVTQNAWNGAWRHMIAECSEIDALTLTEPDELILVTVRRVSNGGVDNAATVYGLTVDFHYETDRDATPNKSPDFYI